MEQPQHVYILANIGDKISHELFNIKHPRKTSLQREGGGFGPTGNAQCRSFKSVGTNSRELGVAMVLYCMLMTLIFPQNIPTLEVNAWRRKGGGVRVV